jgi:hypothetical protein
MRAECHFHFPKLGCSESSFPKRRGCKSNLPKLKLALQLSLLLSLTSKPYESFLLSVMVYRIPTLILYLHQNDVLGPPKALDLVNKAEAKWVRIMVLNGVENENSNGTTICSFLYFCVKLIWPCV